MTILDHIMALIAVLVVVCAVLALAGWLERLTRKRTKQRKTLDVYNSRWRVTKWWGHG